MSVHNAIITARHTFTAEDYDAQQLPFVPSEYSRLKYGDDSIAKKYGYELAERFFELHFAVLIVQQCVVIPSPYNFVPNAATIMTRHFVDRLNHLIVQKTGLHVDYATIQRKVNYTGDFGLLDAEARRQLIGGDTFYVHQGFFENKTMLFVDDVRITGAHENRLMEIIDNCERLRDSNIHFLYYGQLVGDESRNDIEAYLNSAEMTLDMYIEMQREPANHLIVRPIKWLMRMNRKDFETYLTKSSIKVIRDLYFACLGEGYYAVPEYQCNYHLLRNMVV